MDGTTLYEMWNVSYSTSGDRLGAVYMTKLEVIEPCKERILELLYDFEYIEHVYDKSGMNLIHPVVTSPTDGIWQIDSRITIIELRRL